MSANSLHEFMDLPLEVDLTDELGMIYLYHESLTEEQAQELFDLAKQHLPEGRGYEADFDLKTEVTAQLQAVRALRSRVITASGQAKEGVSSRDMKEVVSASNTLLQTLLKTHEKILNYDRQRAIEKATIEAVKTLPDEAQTLFFDQLEKQLEMIQ